MTVTSQSAKYSSAGGVLGHAEHGRVEHDVRAGALVDQRLGGGGGFDVDDRREEVDVDEHRFRGVDALGRGLGDDRGDGSPT